jgi:hypothetical protein
VGRNYLVQNRENWPDVVNTIMNILVPIDGRIILKCIFKKWEVRRGTDLPRSG